MRKDNEGNVFEDIPEISKDRIFLFKGEEGMSGPETTTEELDEFIRSCRPGPNQATTIKKFNYADYLETAKNTSNKDLQNVANNEIEALKRALENGDAQVAEMMKRNQEDRKTAQSRL